MISIANIKAKADIVEFIGSRITIQKQGSRFIAVCPFHKERSGSLVISPQKQAFKCFGCGKSGDVIDFLVYSGKTFQEACAELENPGPRALIPNYNRGDAQKSQIWNPIDPAPFFSMYAKPRFTHYKYGEPDNIYTYHNEQGGVYAYTCRFNLPSGKKEVLPFTYCTNGERDEWRWRGLAAPRPLYNLHLLQRPLPVLLSEGEKTCDSLHAILGSRFNCLTWIGGKEGVINADWKPLKGRELLLWPDNDEPGEAAMNWIQSLLSPQSPKIKFVSNPQDAEKGWDFADSDWDYATTIDYLKTHIH